MKMFLMMVKWFLFPVWAPFWLWGWAVWGPVRATRRVIGAKSALTRTLSVVGFFPTAAVSLAVLATTVGTLGLGLHAVTNPLGPNGTIFFLAEHYVRYKKMELKNIEELVRNYHPDTASMFYGIGGSLATDPDSAPKVLIGEYGTRRRYLTAAEINPRMKQALVAVEDATFEINPGIEWAGIARAFLKTYVLKSATEGGSTLTQQLVKNLTGDREKDKGRKFREWLLARDVRKAFSSDRVLEILLNNHEFTGTIFGVEEASKYFFGSSQDQLSIGQAAMLAGLFKGIETYNPCSDALTPKCAKEHDKKVKNPCNETKKQAAERRRQTVLRYRLRNSGIFSTQEEYEEALRPLTYTCRSMRAGTSVSSGPLFARLEFERVVGAAAINRGYTVDTSIHPMIQTAAEEALRGVVDELNKKFPPDAKTCRSDLSPKALKAKEGIPVSPVQGAMVVLRRETRDILALVGGTGSGLGTFNRAFQMYRHPGSTKKVCTYGAAFEAGCAVDTLVMDEAVSFQIPGSLPWEVKNHDNVFEDRAVTTLYAFATSKNTVAAVLANRVSPAAINDFCRRAGITTNQQNRLTTSIGGAEGVSLLDLTNVYATVAADGKRVKPSAVRKIRDSNEVVTYARTVDPETVMTSSVAYMLLELERAVVESPRGTAHRLAKHTKAGYEVRGKTGTTGHYHDAYFCGATPEIVFCTWLGRDSNDMIGKGQGSPFAVTVVDNFLTKIRPLLTKGLTFNLPDSVEYKYMADDGTVTSSATPGALKVAFPKLVVTTTTATTSFGAHEVLRHDSADESQYAPGDESEETEPANPADEPPPTAETAGEEETPKQ